MFPKHPNLNILQSESVTDYKNSLYISGIVFFVAPMLSMNFIKLVLLVDIGAVIGVATEVGGVSLVLCSM